VRSVLLVCAVIFGFVSPLLAEDFKGAPRNMVHYDVEGKRFELADYIRVAGEFAPIEKLRAPVMVVFGAHWCEPCKALMQDLQKQRALLEEKKVYLVYVHVDDVDRTDFGHDSATIKKLAQELAKQPAYQGARVLLGGDLDAVRQWMGDETFSMLPGVLMFDADGRLIEHCGSKDFGDAFERYLAALGGD